MPTTTPGPPPAPDADTPLRELLTRWAARPGRGVIFDFNGTLSNDEPVLLQIFTEMFLDHLEWTLTPNYYYSELAGRSDREIIDIVVEQFGGNDPELAAQLLLERRRRYCELVTASSPITAGAAQLVRRLAHADVPIAIVTGAQRQDVEFVLDHSLIDGLITTIVTEEDVRRGKPDPEGFLLGARLLGLDPKDILVFEDSRYGLQAARAAGMLSLAVVGTRGRAELEAEADGVVDALAPELLSVLLASGQEAATGAGLFDQTLSPIDPAAAAIDAEPSRQQTT